IRLYDQSLTECATEALTLLNQESPQATQQIERELRAELDSVARLAQEFGGESRIVQRQKEVFFRRILQEIGVRIDRRRHRNSRDGAVLTRLDNLLATVRLGENTASNRYVGSIDLLARISDPVNAVGWRERFGEQFDLEIVGNITGPIWGTDVYTDDSAIATAAVHAGLVQVGEKATVTVTIVRPGKYVGSTRHGVTSSDWSNAWLSSYVLQRKLAVKPIERADSSGPGASWQLPPNQLQFNFWVANPTNSIPFQEQLGAQFDVEVTGHAGGAIWGTDVYTSDSNVGMAAVHAGLLQVGEKATVTVTIVKSPEKYAGSIRHGITSSDYGPFVSGYILSRTQDASKTSSAQFDQALLNTPFNQQELRHNELWMELLVDCPNDQFDQAARQHLLDSGRYFVFPRPDEPPCSPWLAKLRKDESVKLQSLAFAARTRALRPGELPSEHWNLLALNPAIEIGQTFYCAVTGRVDGVVWGAGPYTSDSDIGTAAVHAGWVKEGETRVLTVRIVDGTKEASFSGSTANGVATQAFGPYPTAFIFEQLPLNVPESVPSTTTSLRKVLIDVTLEELEEVRADEQRATQVLNKRLRDLQANSEIVLPSPAGKSPSRERHTLTSFRNRVGQSFYFFVMGTDYGVSHREGNSFSLESDLGHAATKSGAVKAGEFGVVQVKIIKGPVQSRRPDAVLSDAAPATDEVRFTVEKASDAVAKKFLHLEGGEPKLSPELATELVRFTEAINQNRTSLEPFPEFTNSPFGMGQARYVAATCYGADLQRNAASALSNATQALQFPLTMPQRVRLHLIAGDASLMIVKPSASQRRLDAAAWYLDGLQLIREFQIPEQLPVGAPEFTDFAFPLNGKGRSVVEVLHGLRASLRGHLLDVYGNLNISKPDVDELRKLREMAQDRLLATDDFLKQVRRIGAARQ
ncbi:MAG: hypothetical protein JWM11_2052, partial [Planctomycetaceae bacterium]|nr:hypothetical protein [Planctomycetaceae bacterium]